MRNSYLVEQNPEQEIIGIDSQLEKAVEVALELLKTEGVELKSQPADPVKVPKKGEIELARSCI